VLLLPIPNALSGETYTRNTSAPSGPGKVGRHPAVPTRDIIPIRHSRQHFQSLHSLSILEAIHQALSPSTLPPSFVHRTPNLFEGEMYPTPSTRTSSYCLPRALAAVHILEDTAPVVGTFVEGCICGLRDGLRQGGSREESESKSGDMHFDGIAS